MLLDILIYRFSVKKSLLKKCSIILFSIALTSCQLNGKSGISFASENPRIISPEDYLVDFSKGETGNFYAADRYSNGLPFNCIWSRNAVKVENGLLNLKLYEENDKIYGAEYRSRVAYHYGYYATKMKPADCSGVISSFFTYTNNPVWDEIDIEFLGKNMNQVQFNYFTNGVGGHEYIYNLKFDASKEFHEYGFEWLEDSITWFVDGVKVYMVTQDIPSHPQNIMMNLWNCVGRDSWSGDFEKDRSKLPVYSQYQYLVYIPA